MEGKVVGLDKLECFGGDEFISILCANQMYYAPVAELGKYNANKLLGTHVVFNFKTVKENKLLCSILEAREGMKEDLLEKIKVGAVLREAQVMDLMDKGTIVEYRGGRFFLPRNYGTRCGVHPKKLWKKGDKIDCEITELQIYDDESNVLPMDELVKKPSLGIVSRLSQPGLKDELWSEDNCPYQEKGIYQGSIARILEKSIVVELDGDVPVNCVHPGFADIDEGVRVKVRVLNKKGDMRFYGSIQSTID